MLPECEAAVEEALGRPLRKGEADELEQQINYHMRQHTGKDRAEWMAMSQGDRYQWAAKATADSMLGDLQKKQQRVRLQIAVHDRVENMLNSAIDRLPEDRQHFWQLWKQKPGTAELRRVSNLLAFDSKGAGVQSAESRSTAITAEAFGRLMPLWQSVKGFAHLFENKQGISDLIHELYGEDTGNAAAKAGAQAWRTVTEELRQRANAAGMDIGKLEDWAKPQAWSQGRVASAGENASASLEKFTSEMLPLLDRDKYLNTDGTRMSDGQVQRVLRKVFDSIITDGKGDQIPGKAPVGGSLSNRMSQHRALYFKDADSYLTAQGLYGQKSLWPTLTGHVISLSRDIGLLEALGPNPESTFRYFNDRTWADALRATPENKSSIDSAAKFNQGLFDYVAGRRDAGNPKIAAAFQAFRNFETATKLGKVVITALGDEAGMAATAFANHVPYSEVAMRELHYLNPLNGDDRAVATHSGLGYQSMIQGLSRFGQDDLFINSEAGMAGAAKNVTSKMASGVMNVSGAEHMWDTRRKALGSVLQSYLGKWTREVDNFSDINEADHGVLARKGITDIDWQVWKKAELEDWGMKHGVLTPQSVRAIPDEKIDEAISPHIDQIHNDIQQQLSDLSAKDIKEQGWINTRAEKLGNWVSRMRARLNDQASQNDNQVQSLSKKLGSLYDQLDTANSYFKQTASNQVSLSALRKAGVSEGRNESAVDQVAGKLRQAMRDTVSVKANLESDFKEEFSQREHEINQLIESGDERKIAFAMDRFDQLFTEANARLTDRLQGADEKLTSKITGSVEKLSSLRERIQSADDIWSRANSARTNFSDVRAQGVREGRARESVVDLKRQIRELTRGTEENESLKDFNSQWDDRRKEFEEFVGRAQKRMQLRQQIAERAQKNLEPRIALARENARRNAATSLLGHVLEEVGMGVMDTGARQRAGVTYAGKPGTVGGELLRSAMLFKSFSLSMMQKHWARAASLEGNYATANYAARILVGGTILGALATQLRNIAAGKDPANIAEPQFWGESLLRGGGLGFYGDFLYGELTSHDTTLIPALEGPAASETETLWNITGAAGFRSARGERVDEGAKVLRFIRGNIPFANMWYTQAAFDHLIWNQMQESASPGYLERMQSNASAQRGTSYWWDPSDKAPANAPDFARMWQPERGADQMQKIAGAFGQ